MTHPALVAALVLMLLVAALSVIGRRIQWPSPILMLGAGSVFAFLPGIPQLHVDPEMILMLLLPPLLYTSGVGMSWRGFRANLRPILLLSVGCVLFTAALVAAAAHYLLGLGWAVGFVLGAVVSPPDSVAPMAALRSIQLPRRIVTVLEGESLVNDATALVTLSLAIAAVGSATFSLPAAVVQFALIVVGEIGFGLLVGFAMLWLRHRVADPRAEVLIALATPFIAFWPPHGAGGSGVIACVTAGLYVSWNGRTLIRPATRLQGYFIWDLVVWVAEALAFLLAGLQANAVVSALTSSGWQRPLLAGLVVSATVILVRFIWVFPATYVPRWLLPSLRRADPSPDWRATFFVAFTGLRGAVSLAAALLIPQWVDGAPFPDRDLVLFATYSVIVVTLIGLGGVLPRLARALGLDVRGAQESREIKQTERRVRLEAIDEVLAAIAANKDAMKLATLAAELRRRHEDRRLLFTSEEPFGCDEQLRHQHDLDLVAVEREAVARAFAENRLSDEARRRIERELDLEEARIRHAMDREG